MPTTRNKIFLEQLARYFESKGKVLNIKEYKESGDVPIRFAQVKRIFGSWTRLEQMVRVNYPDIFDNSGIVKAKPASKVAPKPKEVAKKPETVKKDENS